MRYPIYHIDGTNLGEDLVLALDYVHESEYMTIVDGDSWPMLRGGHFVDSDGAVYRLVDRESATPWYLWLIGMKRYRLLFVRTHRHLDLEEVRQIMKAHVLASPPSKTRDYVLDHIDQPQTLSSLILWEW